MRYIYCITNLINGKNYFGQRKLAEGRTWETDTYRGSGKLLNLAYQKYGKENFKRDCLIIGDYSKQEIDELEKYYIAEARKIGKAEYNLADGGQGGCGIYTEFQRQIASLTGKKNWSLEMCSKGGKINVLKRNNFIGKNNPAYGKKWKVRDSSRMGKGCIGFHWFTNGIEEIKSKECPNGYKPGRIY